MLTLTVRFMKQLVQVLYQESISWISTSKDKTLFNLALVQALGTTTLPALLVKDLDQAKDSPYTPPTRCVDSSKKAPVAKINRAWSSARELL